MSKRALLPISLFYLIVSAIHVRGSLWSFSSGPRARNPRYASCSSCPRDCPAALSSPWYDDVPYEDKSYDTGAAEQYGERSADLSALSALSAVSENPWYRAAASPYEEYNGGYGSRTQRSRPTDFRSFLTSGMGSSTYDSAARGLGGLGERAPYSSSATSGSAAQATGAKSSRDVTRYDRPEYWNPNSYGLTKSPLGRSYRSEYESVFSRSLGDNRPQETASPNQEKNHASSITAEIYNEFSDNDNTETTDEGEPSRIPLNTNPADPRLSRTEYTAHKQLGQLQNILGRVNPYYTSRTTSPRQPVHSPEIKYNPYNLSPDLNVLKMVRGIDRQLQARDEQRMLTAHVNSELIRNFATRQNDARRNFQWSQMEPINMMSRDVRKEAFEQNEKNDSTAERVNAETQRNDDDNIQKDRTISDRRKEELPRRRSIAQEEILPSKLEPYFVDDIEEPPLQPTEPTVEDIYSEASTMQN